jgi:membrane protein
MKLRSFTRRLQGNVRRLGERPAISFVINIIKELGEDGAGDMAGSIAYYAILSIFPLLLGVIALLGLFLPSETVQDQVFDFANQYLPGSNEFVKNNIDRIIEFRNSLGLFALFGLFWTGSAIFGAIGRVINRAWGIYKYRPFYIRKLRDIMLALGTSIIFFLSMASTVFASLIPVIDLPVLELLGAIAGWTAGVAFIFTAFLLLYKFMPNTKTSWRYVWPAAVFSTLLFEIATTAFTFYLTNFASYDIVYGSVAVVIILLVWIYISAFIIILGAEFASEYVKLRQDTNRG